MLKQKADLCDRLQRSIGMQQHLRVSLDPLVELLVCVWRRVKIDLVRYHERRLRSPRDDQVAKVAVIGLHIALTRAKR